MTTVSAKVLRLAAATILATAALLPSASPVGAADDGILRFGTTQDLDSMNPWTTALSTGFEAFTLNYDLLVNFGSDLEPIPGFAESWSRVDNPDGTYTWTFKIHEGMTWSDGTPATAEDARWTLQFALDGIEEQGWVGLGYIDPDLYNAGVVSVEAPDPATLVITNTDPSDRVLQMYIPILPKHVWGDQTIGSIDTFENAVPVVGSGPYQAVEWKTGQFARFVRNPDYQGAQGAAEEVVLQFFGSQDTMVQALKSGELDYAQGVTPEQFEDLKDEPDIDVVNATTNGWTMLNINSYNQDIPGGGASTKALRDPAFRDALGYAIDKPLLIERILGGYGVPGTTQVPPFQERWHVEPDNLRTFDLELADQKLTAAGYPLDASGNRLDKEGNPINLRMFVPTDSSIYPKAAEFIKEWFRQIGIEVSVQVLDEAALIELELPPEAGEGYTAPWDLIIWGWTGYADPNPLIQIFTTDLIGSSSDSLYSNPEYDELYNAQNVAPTDEARKELLARMQNLFYDEAPYHILFYEDTLVAYRTDHFGGWKNQPANGAPLYGYGSLGYTLLTPPAEPTPSPTAAPVAPSAGPDATPAPETGSGTTDGGTTLLLVAVLAVIGVAVGVFVMRRRSSASGAGTDEE